MSSWATFLHESIVAARGYQYNQRRQPASSEWSSFVQHCLIHNRRPLFDMNGLDSTSETRSQPSSGSTSFFDDLPEQGYLSDIRDWRCLYNKSMAAMRHQPHLAMHQGSYSPFNLAGAAEQDKGHLAQQLKHRLQQLIQSPDSSMLITIDTHDAELVHMLLHALLGVNSNHPHNFAAIMDVKCNEEEVGLLVKALPLHDIWPVAAHTVVKGFNELECQQLFEELLSHASVNLFFTKQSAPAYIHFWTWLLCAMNVGRGKRLLLEEPFIVPMLASDQEHACVGGQLGGSERVYFKSACFLQHTDRLHQVLHSLGTAAVATRHGMHGGDGVPPLIPALEAFREHANGVPKWESLHIQALDWLSAAGTLGGQPLRDLARKIEVEVDYHLQMHSLDMERETHRAQASYSSLNDYGHLDSWDDSSGGLEHILKELEQYPDLLVLRPQQLQRQARSKSICRTA